MNERLFKGKSKRTKIFAAITLAALLILLLVNALLYHIGIFKTVFWDMTPEGLYSLSDAMKKECDEMFSEITADDPEKKVKITFCTDTDYLLSAEKSRLAYFTALMLGNRYGALEVETVNVVQNPTAVSKYKTTSLSEISSDDVIISYGDKYRIVKTDYFWTNGTKDGDKYYNGEYRIASLIKSITSINHPIAYFVTDHGETYYDPEHPESETSIKTAAFADLLKNRGMEIKTLNLSQVDKIPEDCALLIINNPRTDFTYDASKLNSFNYVSDTEKIDRYLVTRQGAVAIAKDYAITLPVLESFLHEWGFDFSESVVVDKESSIADEKNTGTGIIAVYDTDEDSYGYAIYGEYADLSSAPLTVFKNTGSISCSYTGTTSVTEPGCSNTTRSYASYLASSETAQRYMTDAVTGEVTTVLDGIRGSYDLAALSVRKEYDSYENNYKLSSVFCVNSSEFFSNDLLGEASYANYDITAAVIENISQVEDRVSAELGALSLNVSGGGGKYLIPTEMSSEDVTVKTVTGTVIKNNHGISTAETAVYTAVVFAVPLAVGIVGIIVCIKRRYL